MLALSRLPIHCGWMVFFGYPLALCFRAKKSEIMAGRTSIFYCLYRRCNVLDSGSYFFGLIGIAIVYFLFYWLCFYAISRIGRFYPRLFYPNFIAVMLSFEYLQNFGETRFPWFNNAYSLSDLYCFNSGR